MSSVEQNLLAREKFIPHKNEPARPQPASARPATVWLLIVLQGLLGLGAVFGGGTFILGPDGRLLGVPLGILAKSPFSDFLLPGLLLFFLVGVFPLVVAYSLWRRPAWRWPNLLNPFKQRHWSWAASLAAGVIVIVWIVVEILFVGIGWVHVLYLAWGGVILALTLLPAVRRYCAPLA